MLMLTIEKCGGAHQQQVREDQTWKEHAVDADSTEALASSDAVPLTNTTLCSRSAGNPPRRCPPT